MKVDATIVYKTIYDFIGPKVAGDMVQLSLAASAHSVLKTIENNEMDEEDIKKILRWMRQDAQKMLQEVDRLSKKLLPLIKED